MRWTLFKSSARNLDVRGKEKMIRMTKALAEGAKAEEEEHFFKAAADQKLAQGLNKVRGWWPFFIFLLGLDVATKILAIEFIPPLHYGTYPFGGIGIFSLGGITFSLNYIVNTGAAWGVFAGHSGLLFALRMLIVLGLLIFVPKRFPIWLVLTGAIGNAIDFCLYGHVIDFFHFTFWGYSFPIFNIADSCISIGVICLLLFSRKVKQPAL